MTDEYVGWLDEDWNIVLDQSQPIVRCRDCTNYATDELGYYCTLMDFEDVKDMADMFCAWGERKSDA